MDDRKRWRRGLFGALLLHASLVALAGWSWSPTLTRQGSPTATIEIEEGEEEGGGQSGTPEAPATASSAPAEPELPVERHERPLPRLRALAASDPALSSEVFELAADEPEPRIGVRARRYLLRPEHAPVGSGMGDGSGRGAGSGTGDGFGGLLRHSRVGNLKVELCLLPEGTQSIKDLARCDDLGTAYVDRINIPRQSFDAGFPGVPGRSEFFAARYAGIFAVRRAGDYKFRLVSDDGSQLFIDQKLVIDHDGWHDARSLSESVELAAGEHHIMLRYFQGPRFELALQLFVTPPDQGERLFSTRL